MVVRAQIDGVNGDASQGGAYALLKLDLLALLVPRQEIRTLEPATDIDSAQPPADGVGWITVADHRWPVFCFSEQLKRLTVAPATRSICAVLSAGNEAFGFMCSDVGMLRLPDARITAMPEAMVLPGRPIHGLALHQDTVMCLSSSARLFAHACTERGLQ